MPPFRATILRRSQKTVSEISVLHSGCCSPGLGEKESSKYGLGFSHAVTFEQQVASPRDVSEISGHSGCCSPGFGEKESSKYGLGFSHAALSSNKCESQQMFRKSAGIAGAAVLALVTPESSKYGLGFSHAALSSNKCESQRCFGNQRAFRVLQSWLCVKKSRASTD